MNSGLTSVTFRQLDYMEIIRIAKKCRLDGIEWGGDIHVPAGDIKRAKSVGDDTISAGLKVLSYGSYFRVGENDDTEKSFKPVLETAVALNAPVIRIWAGAKGSSSCDDAYYQKIISDTKMICHMARVQDITISFEYHRGTLTDTSDSALRLIKAVDYDNLNTYWQPNPDISHRENVAELKSILPYLRDIHVFHWTENDMRQDLESGAGEWLDYIRAVETDGKVHHFILEFVKDNQVEQFVSDADTLLSWIK